tara:strand:+ start:15 stop:263 length:249 start_codon:yes stop_codon:yes gene_type:complete
MSFHKSCFEQTLKITNSSGVVESFNIPQYDNLRKIGNKTKLAEHFKVYVDDWEKYDSIPEDVKNDLENSIFRIGRTYYFNFS